MFHTPNEGKRGPWTANKLKGMGMVPGIPDFTLIFAPQTVRLIELKVKGKYLSKNQKAVREALEALGCDYAVCYTLDEFIDTVSGWTKRRLAA